MNKQERVYSVLLKELKECNTCHWALPRSEFHRNCASKDGLIGMCNLCRKEQRAEYYQKNRQKLINYSSEYSKENREQINEYSRKWGQENKERGDKKMNIRKMINKIRFWFCHITSFWIAIDGGSNIVFRDSATIFDRVLSMKEVKKIYSDGIILKNNDWHQIIILFKRFGKQELFVDGKRFSVNRQKTKHEPLALIWQRS